MPDRENAPSSASARSDDTEPTYPANKFGDVITCDRVSSQSESGLSVDNDGYGLVMVDVATDWLAC